MHQLSEGITNGLRALARGKYVWCSKVTYHRRTLIASEDRKCQFLAVQLICAYETFSGLFNGTFLSNRP